MMSCCSATYPCGHDGFHNGATKAHPLVYTEADSLPQDQVDPRRVGESNCDLQDSVDPVV